MTRGGGAAPVRWLGVVLAVGFIGALTLRPALPALNRPPLTCIVCGGLGGVDVLLNVALFVPLGAALFGIGLRWPRATGVALASSLLIETLQYTLIRGRDATLSDLLTNTLGGMIGALLASHWRFLLLPPPRVARWLSVCTAVVVAVIMGATAALLQPSIPEMGMWGQWTPQQLAFEPYTGTVHSFHVNDVYVPYDLVPESEPLRRRLLSGETRGSVDLTTGQPTHRLSAIARAGSRLEEVFFIGARGTDLVFRTRLAVNDWRLRVPGIVLPDAFPVPGERVAVMAGLHDNRWYATVHDGRGTSHFEVPFSVGLGWSFIFPFDRPLRPGDGWLSALWLAALALPAALWGSRGGEGRAFWSAWSRPWLMATELLLAALLLIPHVARFAPPSAWEWGGILAGCLAGALLAWYAQRRLEFGAPP